MGKKDLEKDIINYLKQNSTKYANVTKVTELAKGGEAIVFRVDH